MFIGVKWHKLHDVFEQLKTFRFFRTLRLLDECECTRLSQLRTWSLKLLKFWVSGQFWCRKSIYCSLELSTLKDF